MSSSRSAWSRVAGAPGGLWIGMALLVAVGLFVALRFELATGISGFLPRDDRQKARLSRHFAEGPLSRTMIVTIAAARNDARRGRAAAIERAVSASIAFEKALRADPTLQGELASIEGGPAAGADRAIWTLYYPRRFGFLAADRQHARARLEPAALARAARELKARLAQPISTALSRSAPHDPLMILPRFFERLASSRAEDLKLIKGRFVTRDERFAVLFVATRASAFAGDVQGRVLAGLERAIARVKAASDVPLRVEYSGINRFAVSAQRAIKADIQRVSIVSSVLLAALLLLLFGSLRLVVLAAIPLGIGMLCGCGAVLLAHGKIHGITLAFGASLIGVCFDYVVHLYCHHALSLSPDGRASIKAIWWAIATGAATTVAGFATLFFSSLRGLQEVALFAAVGLIATLLATRFLLPGLLPETRRPMAPRRVLAIWLGRLYEGLERRRRALWLLPVLVLLVAAFGLPRASWNPSFASLGQLDPRVRAEDERVRGRVAHAEQLIFIAALGKDDERALQVNDRIARALVRSQAAGELKNYRSLASLLPSARTQRAVAAVLQADRTLRVRFEAAFGAEGFVVEAFAPFFRDVRKAPVAPLTFRDLDNSPLAMMVRPFRLVLRDQSVALLTLVSGVRDATALQKRLAAIDGAVLVRQRELFARANRLYQRETAQLLAIGLVAVLLLLVVRYRRPRSVACAFLPALLAALVTLSALAWVGHPIDLVSLTSLLMVVSMGVDYGVFLVDAAQEQTAVHRGADDCRQGDRGRRSALLSVFVTALSTLFGFGLLAFSNHPLLRSIGLTAAVGITACLLFAPVAVVLARMPTK